MLKADLHIHSTASDGKLKPSDIVRLALERKLDVIAITDHDTIAGHSEAFAAAEGSDLRIVRGVEISTMFNGREAHLLAYSFQDEEIIHQLLRSQKEKRIERAKSIITRLKKLGFDISYDEVRAEAGRATIGRPHIARVLVRKKYAADNNEVFIRYLSDRSCAYEKMDYPDIVHVIKLIHLSGGFAVIAHPSRSYNFIEIKYLKDSGLDGIECLHPSHNLAAKRRYQTYCDNYGLIATGGSDFHGSTHDMYHFGAFYLPMQPESPLFNQYDSEETSILEHNLEAL